MHAIVFIPAAVFCAVTAISVAVCAIIDRRAAAAGRHVPAAPAALPALRPVFRPVVIEGGLKTAPAAAGTLRAAQSPLRSAGAALTARSA